jgi:hypothetical protein
MEQSSTCGKTQPPCGSNWSAWGRGRSKTMTVFASTPAGSMRSWTADILRRAWIPFGSSSNSMDCAAQEDWTTQAQWAGGIAKRVRDPYLRDIFEYFLSMWVRRPTTRRAL